MYIAQIKKLFTPKDTFSNNEWILKHQIFSILVVSFTLGIGIFLFAIYRVTHDNVVAGIGQFLFSFFLLYSFIKLRQDKTFYRRYSMLFFFTFFIYIHIVFFFVPQNHLNVLWIVTAPVLIFFFLDKKRGLIFFFLLLMFILYLLATNYPYSLAEYITLFAALSTTTLIMYAYEKVKEAEKSRLLSYNTILEKEIEKKTQKLNQLNTDLEVRVEKEVSKRITQEEMLLRKSRMANMGEMIDAIAHQWRQPLMNINAVMMNIDRGIETHKEPPLLKEKVLEVFSLTAHMSHTIEDFRNLLKVEKEKDYFLLEDLVGGVVSLLKSNLKCINVHCDVEKGLGITGYKSELSQVLITLLCNASEALHSKSIEDGKITINVRQDKQTVIMKITDNAGGIKVTSLEKLFDPYFTTKEQTGGTGLGLHIAQLIVEHNMNGVIRVENTKQGACFTVVLPQ